MLESGMAFRDLVVKVKDRLLLNSTDTTIKVSFQYPVWLSIDDGDGSTPQYITADDEVQAFIQMRRSIEEVDLCVTVTRYFNGWPTSLHTSVPSSAVVGHPNIKGNGEGMYSDDDSSNSWYDFVMSDTPLTFPTQLQSGAPAANTDRSCRSAVRNTGITIREREEVIRLASPAYNLRGKGKGKVVTSASNVQSDTDSDSDEDALVPTLTNRHSRIGESSSKVRRRLTFSQVAGLEPEASSDEDTNDNTPNDGDVPLTE
uniref:Uncharacterized protein n=1 Tax=Noccaea caerulescens TaxID=107243 RepID=A0A1J3CQR5_NOCCA